MRNTKSCANLHSFSTLPLLTTFVAEAVVVLLQHSPQVSQRLAALMQQCQHPLPDAHVTHQPQVADDEGALRADDQRRGPLLTMHTPASPVMPHQDWMHNQLRENVLANIA